jgi:hypothetical protein
VKQMPSHTIFRRSTFLLAVVLAAQSAWLLFAELSRSSGYYLPTDPQSAALASRQRNRAEQAARIGLIRGDLWAESAYSYAELLWARSGNASEPSASLSQAWKALDRSVSFAPHQAGVWLLLAGLASRYQWPKLDPAEALRMSYYTGPNELSLIPFRLLLMMRLDKAGDSELNLFADRDLRVLVARKDETAILQAYQAATPAGKQFIEQALVQSDPRFVDTLRAGAQ